MSSRCRSDAPCSGGGFTLIEVLLVMVMISIFAGTALRTMQPSLDRKRFEATAAEMEEIARAIVGDARLIEGGSRIDFGYVGDIGALPSTLDDLVEHPGLATWGGPYLARFEEDQYGHARDAWGDDYGYAGTMLSSEGGAEGEELTLMLASNEAALLYNTVTGTLRDAAASPPGYSYVNLSVWMSYPDGVGSELLSAVDVDPSGRYTFDSEVPIGRHTVYAALEQGLLSDTVSVDLTVYPGRATHQDLLFGFTWPSQGGSGLTALEYVEGSALITGPQNNKLVFRVLNTSEIDIELDYLVCSYEKTAYFQRVTVDATLVANSPQARYGSGEAVRGVFPVIRAGSNVEIKIEHFRNRPNYHGDPVDMRGVEFELDFSDGSTMSFGTTGIGQ